MILVATPRANSLYQRYGLAQGWGPAARLSFECGPRQYNKLVVVQQTGRIEFVKISSNCFTFNYMLFSWHKKHAKASDFSGKKTTQHDCLINLRRNIVCFEDKTFKVRVNVAR